MLARFSQHGKVIALVAGFLFSAVGALWALLVTDRIGTDIQELSDQRSVNTAQIDALNQTASQYFVLNQQGDLIFVTANQAGSNRELVADVYQGNMLDRRTPVVNMIGVLALQNQLDFQKALDAYDRLVDDTRRNLSLANFARLKAAEADIIKAGQARVPKLVEENAEIDQQLNAKKAQQSRNHVLGVVTALIGSAALLAANLISERKILDQERAGEQPAESPEPRG